MKFTRHLTLAFFLVITALSNDAEAQITKEEFTTVLTKMGGSIEDVNYVFLGGIQAYYTNGTSGVKSEIFKGDNIISFKASDNGFTLQANSGKLEKSYFFSYDKMSYFKVQKANDGGLEAYLYLQL